MRITSSLSVMVSVALGEYVGRGEGCPLARYNQSALSEQLRLWVRYFGIRKSENVRELQEHIQTHMRAGAARNALDCALWDIRAKMEHTSAGALLGCTSVRPLIIPTTISLDTPERMADAARGAQGTLLKLKLGADGDGDRLRAVRAARSDAEIIVDVNEGWDATMLRACVPVCEAVGVTCIEQPVREGCDTLLRSVSTHIPYCADESFRTTRDFERIAPWYQAVNIKLDKTGGLTEALRCMDEAHARGMRVMVGCMLGSSLSLAPAFYLAQTAHYADLDSARLLVADGEHGMQYSGEVLSPPSPLLWGSCGILAGTVYS